MRRQYSREEKQNLVARFRLEDKSADSFAEENGIKAGTFKSWLYTRGRKIDSEQAVSGFVEVKVPVKSSDSGILIRKSGIEIEIPAEYGEEKLRTILTVLAAL